jgi:hypothetical protein
MKVTIEFDGNEEREELREALDGYKWKIAVWDMDQVLRNVIRRGYIDNREATTEEIDSAEKIRELLIRILENYNLNLD